MPNNECIPYFEPGTRITGRCTAAVTGRRFVAPSAAPTGGMAGTENPRVAHAAAAPLGVACYDGVLDEEIPLVRGNAVVPVEAGAAIAVGARVESAADGRAVTLATGVPAGVALEAATAAGDIIAVALNL